MRNASRRPDEDAPDDEPARTSFVCACCGQDGRDRGRRALLQPDCRLQASFL